MTDISDYEKALQDRINRLVYTIYKLAGWSGQDIDELIEDGLLKEGDLDTP